MPSVPMSFATVYVAGNRWNSACMSGTMNKKNILMITNFPFIVENLTSRPGEELRGKILLRDFVEVELLGCVGLVQWSFGGTSTPKKPMP